MAGAHTMAHPQAFRARRSAQRHWACLPPAAPAPQVARRILPHCGFRHARGLQGPVGLSVGFVPTALTVCPHLSRRHGACSASAPPSPADLCGQQRCQRGGRQVGNGKSVSCTAPAVCSIVNRAWVGWPWPRLCHAEPHAEFCLEPQSWVHVQRSLSCRGLCAVTSSPARHEGPAS